MAALKLSYVHGASEQPLIGQTIGQFFDAVCDKWPARPALVVRHQNVRLSYGELRQQVDRLAAGLLTLGLHPGDRIGIWSPNNSEWVLTQFATAKAGPDPGQHQSGLSHRRAGIRAQQSRLQGAHPRRAFQDFGLYRHAARAGAGARPRHARQARIGAAAGAAFGGACSATAGIPARSASPKFWRAAPRRRRKRIAELAPQLQFDEPINIQFTSGTTGFPKGATLSHHNILNNGFFIGEAMRLTPEDRLCIPVPLYHCFGMVLGNLAAVTHGACMVFPGEGFDPLVDAGDRRRGALHRAARRADHVHRRTRSSGIRPLRSVHRCAPASWRARRARSR